MKDLAEGPFGLIGKLDFTLMKYDELCRAVANSKYTVVTSERYLQQSEQISSPVLIMRHDIERVSKYALDMARIEHEHNIAATYYFRMRKGTYITDIMDEIASYGHEIGYHYETLDKAKGNIELAIELFESELAEFRKRYQVKTVCAHGNPLTRYDNKDIWKRCKLSDFGLLGEPYLSLDYSKFAYFSDSGRTWINSKAKKMEGKDYVFTSFDDIQPRNTDELIKIVREGSLPNICILIHPERWSKDITSFISRWLLDFAFGSGKRVIYMYRGMHRDDRNG